MKHVLLFVAAFVFFTAPALAATIGSTDPYEPDLTTPEAAVLSSLYSVKHRLPEAYLETQAEWIRRRYGTDIPSQIRGVRQEWAKHGFPEHAEIEVTDVEFDDYPDYDAIVSYDQVRTLPDGRVLRKSVRAAVALEDRRWRVKYAFVEEAPLRAPGTEPYASRRGIRDAKTTRLFK